MGEVREFRPTAGQSLRVDLADLSRLLGRAAGQLATVRSLSSVAAELMPSGALDLSPPRVVLQGQQALSEELSRKLQAISEHLAEAMGESVCGMAIGRDAVAIARLWDAIRRVSTIQDTGGAAGRLLPEGPDLDNVRAVLAGQASLCFELSATLEAMVDVMEGRPE